MKIKVWSILLLSISVPLIAGLGVWAAERPINHQADSPKYSFFPDRYASQRPGQIFSPISAVPPVAALISVGAPDADGNATVTGASDAVPGGVAVVIVNLSTRNMITTTATTEGAFSASLFAPPGSALLVKYDQDGGRASIFWNASQTGPVNSEASIINPLPGTILQVGPQPGSTGEFYDAGYFGGAEGQEWAGWWLEGTITGPAGPGDYDVQPGDMLNISASLRTTSPDLNCSGAPTFTPTTHMSLRYLFDAEGRNHPWGMWFISHLFTPTGLPIEHEAGGEAKVLEFASLINHTCLSPSTSEGTLAITYTVPMTMPAGTYQPELFLLDGGVPFDLDTPVAVIWYHFESIARLPPITVGSPDPGQIPWTLFGDELSNGHRGVNALEDAGDYQVVTRIVYPPELTVLPRFNERTGDVIRYRLEPGSVWLSSNDRRMPNPPVVPLKMPGGEITAVIHNPDGSVDTLGPSPILQSSVRTPTTPEGSDIDEGTGHIGDIFHLHTGDEAFAYAFNHYGPHLINLSGFVEDVYGNSYPFDSTYEFLVARILDLDPAQLPTTPYQQGDAFAPGLHVFPPVPADVTLRVTHLPFSDPAQAVTTTISGQANRFGYFQPPPGVEFRFADPGEFRVDISATYGAPDGTMWAGFVTWGNVVEGTGAQIEAHGRRGLDFEGDTVDDTLAWFIVNDLPADKIGKEIYYPYFSGDIHWGDETPDVSPGDSIHSILTFRDLTGPGEDLYNLVRNHFPRARNRYRWPPVDWSLAGLNSRLAIGEAPLFITTQSGVDPAVDPADIDYWGYWYGSSERPDVHVREIISEDGMGTAYWRFNDTYGYQIGEPADGDKPGDIKWEFGGVVLRVPDQAIQEYAIYSSLWVLLPHFDPVGARVTPPFRGAGALNGGPIMSLLGQDIDMLFLPKGVRPGDVLEVGDTISFSGHVGPPLDSRVEVTITSPGGVSHAGVWQANKIGWLYDPAFDFIADEPGRWTVDVLVEHDLPYPPTGVTPTDHNTGSVLGTSGQYEFYVVPPGSPPLFLTSPAPGFIPWPQGILNTVGIQGAAPPGTTAVHYTIHDKGIVMDQGTLTPGPQGNFSLVYDPFALQADFPMLSLTAHEGLREGLADEVSIHFLAQTPTGPQAVTLTLIGEEVFLLGGNQPLHRVFLPGARR